MAQQPNGERLTGNALAQDLFEDMGHKVGGIGLNGDAEDEEATQRVTEEIESLCMNCHADGITRLISSEVEETR